MHDRAAAPLGAYHTRKNAPKPPGRSPTQHGDPVRLGSEVVLTPFNVLLRHLADALVASSQSGAVLP